MSVLFPRMAFGPARCSPAFTQANFAPLFSLFDDSLNELARPSRQSRKSFVPRFDIKEAKEFYSLEGELPGTDQKDISIEFTDEHTLTIKGRSKRHSESGTRPAALEATQEKAAIEQDGSAAPVTDTDSVKSHHATVEDETSAAPAAPSEATEASTETSEVAAAAPAKTVKPDEPTSRYWVSERSVGEFSRSFSFADRVDQETVRASLKNGILSIIVPKAPKPESRHINIE